MAQQQELSQPGPEPLPPPWQQPQPPRHRGNRAKRAAAASDPSRVWLPELVQRVARSLDPNEIACTLRLVSKATAAQFPAPAHTAVRLSLPAPAAEFARRWASAGAMCSLTLKQRRRLLCLVAASGDTRNLRALVQALPDHCPLRADVFAAAAGAGQLEACRWLRDNGCPWGMRAPPAAAAAGHWALFDWLRTNSCPGVVLAWFDAARGGHVGLLDWLLQSHPAGRNHYLLECAAEGCPLPTLQRLLDRYGQGFAGRDLARFGAAAVASRTPDWMAKVEWLEERGCPRTAQACAAAVSLRDAWRPRLLWLRARGYPLGLEVVNRASCRGNAPALEYLLDEGVRLEPDMAWLWVGRAAVDGSLAVLQVLRARGCPLEASFVLDAAKGGHLPVVAAAARSGSLPLAVWLRERGCPWGAGVFASAAEAGCEELLEWLAEQGCPMGESDEPYVRAAGNGDLATLRCLRRLGCPWNPTCETVARAVRAADGRHCCAVPALAWLLEQGCAVDWVAAVVAARSWVQEDASEVKRWLATQQPALVPEMPPW
ncbi:Ankyrin repeat domain-containing protein [Tetrabaena socialis]|uniref:Ankyrin repeat domain-containing protein n=1 Tax=Tetrabaena socialis TaxID=47790 RepID=A0A2J8AGY8_9CHLO|nr:Ankyrin repeat domain-containing protein [Tetrabaena socialis]|eukprot:PNH11788.1 Ankyrin repeat domain-containing protein [Tetrabaena socialis]